MTTSYCAVAKILNCLSNVDDDEEERIFSEFHDEEGKELEIKQDAIIRKKRIESRHPHFSNHCGFLEEVWPIDEYRDKFIYKNPVVRSVQIGAVLDESEVNTPRFEYISSRLEHMEGGWPKEIDIGDEDQQRRYRRRLMRVSIISF